MAQLKVRDLMTTQVATVEPTATLDDVFKIMDDLDVRHVPIVDQGGILQGIVSDRDLIRATLTQNLTRSYREGLLQERQVGDVMTRDVATVDPDMELGEAAWILLENKISCVPVCEGADLNLIGILTESDFVRYFTLGTEKQSREAS